MNREEWMLALSKMFVERADVDKETADGFAETLAEDMFPDNTPLEAFEEEISCWGE